MASHTYENLCMLPLHSYLHVAAPLCLSKTLLHRLALLALSKYARPALWKHGRVAPGTQGSVRLLHSVSCGVQRCHGARRALPTAAGGVPKVGRAPLAVSDTSADASGDEMAR